MTAATPGPARVTIHEVGPRDGLQNEARKLTVAERIRLIGALAASGLRRIEVGSFVRPDWIPQLAETEEVVIGLPALGLPAEVELSAIVPNRRGLERALACGIKGVAIFMSASEAHNQKNTNKSIDGSLREFAALVPLALAAGLWVRGYLSVVWGCPYQGRVDPRKVLEIAGQLRSLGCHEISLGDTIGVGNPKQTQEILSLLFAGGTGAGGQPVGPFDPKTTAVHLHDTQGTALANCLAAFELGARTFDTAVGGTGGCPYAPGAPGNLATEDLVSMFHDMGVETGVDLPKLLEAGALAQELIGHRLNGRRLQAELGRREQAFRNRP